MSDKKFSELGLPDDILATITDLGFVTPTDIQAAAIPLLLEGRDVVGVANTGTGKTAAFALPLITHIDPEVRAVQALILAPTRELALQGTEAIESLSGGHIDVVSVYGGASYVPQIKGLARGAQIVVGTPGRIMDLMDRGALNLAQVTYFVLDEADEMLRMGFAEDVETIAASLPRERITALFSATMPPAIRKVAETHMTNPVHVSVSSPRSTVATVTQQYAVVPNRHKIGALSRVLATSDADAAIVFVRTRATAEDLALELGARGVQAAALSGDVVQKEREKLVDRLRTGFLDVLVATDVAARGLDVERIGLVINYDVPRETDTYVHRIGRTGRAGRAGRALTFVNPKELTRLKRIAKETSSTMTEVDLPTPAEVSKLRASRLVEAAITRHEAGRLSVYTKVLDEFKARVEEEDIDLSVEDLVHALLALGVRDPGPSGDDEPEKLTVRAGDRDRARTSRRDRPRPTGGATRYRVEVGHRDGVKPAAIVGAITGEGGLKGSDLGKIDIYPSFSLVEIYGGLSDESARQIFGAEVSGRALRIRPDEGPKKHDRKFDRARRTHSDKGRGRGGRHKKFRKYD